MVESVEDYAILMLDAEGRVATWNAGAQRFKGYRAEEIIGQHFSVFYPAEDVAAGKPDRELDVAATDGRLEDEGWRVRKDGTRFWANVVITALRDADGTLQGFGKITRDLTERRASELQLRASEERFRCSFDEARIGMLIIGIDGRYERVNDAFCAIVGDTRERLVGFARENITHPDDVAADAAALRSMLAGEATSHMRDKRYLHAAGHAVWAAINVTLIHDSDGRPLHFIAQVQDITDRRSHERQLQHMADHDPLTGLLNRRSFERELSRHAARVERYGATGSVLMLDLDHFKYFNDTQGHSAGDELIIRIAQGLKSRLRTRTCSRAWAATSSRCCSPARTGRRRRPSPSRCCKCVRDEAPCPRNSAREAITASIGIALFEDGERLTAEEMLVNADLAMYDAKEAGRDRSPLRHRASQRPPKRGPHEMGRTDHRHDRPRPLRAAGPVDRLARRQRAPAVRAAAADARPHG